ncbi:MAG: ABC transporter ATP-binding protein [Acidobacteria bacterium]|nr:ABC transporter ATP-binding protein [Acidobacteriota bacterium]MCK6683037.1 ABC transporter ATP-binding protein [Thermoanaerobaculia bacterium]
MTVPPLLVVRDLSVHYGAIRALDGVSLEVPQGQIVTLIGSNGAGKTTTLRAISGLLTPSAGSIVFSGESLEGMEPHEIVRLGLVQAPEGRGIFRNMTVAENLALGAFIRKDRAGIHADTEEVLSLFPRLRERYQQNAGTLSGGEQQMLAIARAMLARPKLLLLDEPSLGLAPQVVQTIFRIIKEINAKGTTILLVEQNAHMALAVSQQAFVLEVGRIALSGPAGELARSDEVRKAYLGGH